MSSYLERASEVMQALAEDPPDELDDLAEDILASWERGGRTISFGNGGSAADSLHFTAELVGRFREHPVGRPALSLASNPSVLTALSNDFCYDEVFARQVEALVTDRDVVVGLSTSGNSSNVIQALRAARDIGAAPYGLTGRTAGEMGSLDVPTIRVPAGRTPHVQEAHQVCLHRVCEVLDRRLNPD